MSSYTKPSSDSVRDDFDRLSATLRASHNEFIKCMVLLMIPTYIGTWTAFVLVLLKL